MIAKGSTSTVNFYAMNTDGTPAVGKTITATISINGATATSISDTISEVGSGWYKFNHLFNTEGNAFIRFSCTGCIIPPWEEEVVALPSAPSAASVASAVWDASRRTVTNTIPTTTDIVSAVWGPIGYNTLDGLQLLGQNTPLNKIVPAVWGTSLAGYAQNTVGSELNTMLGNYAKAEDICSVSDIADAVWCWTTDTASGTPTVNSTYQKMLAIPANVWTVPSRALTSIAVSYQGDNYILATTSDISDIYNVITGCATSSEVQLLASGMLHWAVSGNTLTLYNNNNTSLGTYTLTRDSSGNITSVTPNA